LGSRPIPSSSATRRGTRVGDSRKRAERNERRKANRRLCDDGSRAIVYSNELWIFSISGGCGHWLWAGRTSTAEGRMLGHVVRRGGFDEPIDASISARSRCCSEARAIAVRDGGRKAQTPGHASGWWTASEYVPSGFTTQWRS
jgi:hypothetical protein